MKKASLLLASLLFAPFAISAQAADAGTSGTGMGMGMGKMSGPHSMMGGKMMGRHAMSGTVDKLDHATGMLTLKTGAGDLMLHFPPPAVKDLKDGDSITVHLAYIKNSAMKK
jgi:hypothetical protein